MKTLFLSISINFFVSINFYDLSAQDTSTLLENYLTISAENNPSLKSKFSQYNATLQRISPAGALPDPELSFGFFVRPMERYMGDQVASISLMQMFPWFGSLGAAKDEATFMAKARFEEFNEARSMLFYEVKATWYALFLMDKTISITQENIEILNTLENIAIARFKSGGGGATGKRSQGMKETTPQSSGSMDGMGTSAPTGSGKTTTLKQQPMQDMSQSGRSGMVDVLRVQMELHELKNSLALLQDERKVLQARFNKLLNRNATEEVILPDSISAAALPVPYSQIHDSIIQDNPMLLMLAQEEKAFSAQERMNKKMGFPMIGLGVQYEIFKAREHSESHMNGKDMWMPMATITLPLWRSKYSSAVREAGFNREAVQQQTRQTQNELFVSLEEAMKDYRDAERRIELYHVLTELALQTQNILTSEYTAAGSDFEELLRMQRQLLDYRLKVLEAKVDQNVAVAMIERLMGR